MTGMISPQNAIERLSQISGFNRVKFIILFGSRIHGQARPGSDVDLCIYYQGKQKDASDFRFRALSALHTDQYDIQIFQQLPLYIRVEVLKGKVLYVSDERLLYVVAREAIRDFGDFSHRYYDYIGERAIS
jgi:uncharacterized protein